MFGADYAGAEERLFLMDVLRHTAQLQAPVPFDHQQEQQKVDIWLYRPVGLIHRFDSGRRLLRDCWGSGVGCDWTVSLSPLCRRPAEREPHSLAVRGGDHAPRI
jgi:hypothetical protein